MESTMQSVATDLAEKYRPRSLDEVVGQDKCVALCRSLIDKGLGGRKLWVSGISGCGKTTIAKILADAIADPMSVREYDSADQLTLGELDEVERTLGLCGWGGRGRCIVVNEAHGLRSGVTRRLLGMLERVPPKVCYIFTTTWAGEEMLMDGIDSQPLTDRCVKIRLTNQGLCKPFAARLRWIAEREGLPVPDQKQAERMIAAAHNSMRGALAELEGMA